jgi:hypothetical protein
MADLLVRLPAARSRTPCQFSARRLDLRELIWAEDDARRLWSAAKSASNGLVTGAVIVR